MPAKGWGPFDGKGFRRIAFAAVLAASWSTGAAASAGSQSALVAVSVSVVETCRIDTQSLTAKASVNLHMRCSESARPNVSLAKDISPNKPIVVGPTQALASPAGERRVLFDASHATAGQILRIEF